MLTITPRAMSVIRRVTAHPQVDPDSGLRIAPGPDQAPLQVRIVPAPREGDRVVERDGGRLYVAPEAVDRITDAELDADTDERGRVQFVARSAA